MVCSCFHWSGVNLPRKASRKRAFAFSSSALRLRHLVNLRQNRRLVRRIGLHQRLHPQFGLLQARLQIDQLHPMLLQNPVHRLALIVGQLQLCHSPRIVPKLPARRHQTPSPWEADARRTLTPCLRARPFLLRRALARPPARRPSELPLPPKPIVLPSLNFICPLLFLCSWGPSLVFCLASYRAPSSSINCASGSIAAGTSRDTSLSTVASRFLILRDLAFAAADCSASCRACTRLLRRRLHRRYPRQLLPVMVLVHPACQAASRQHATQRPASRQPPAMPCRPHHRVRGRLYAASLQASTLALKCFSACASTGSSISPANLSLEIHRVPLNSARTLASARERCAFTVPSLKPVACAISLNSRSST